MHERPGTVTDEVLRPRDTDLAPHRVEEPTSPWPLAVELDGRYQLGAELARGGQSVVYVAYDSHLGREVAFKTLLPEGAGATSTTLSTRAARFVREARVTAQLEHPGIAPVHEVGQRRDGSFYATQKLVRGKTLEALFRACTTPAERFRLLPAYLGLCQAVAYAHQRGVIHRDLKPGNMMVGAFGEAVVIDWGLARIHGQKEAGPGAPPVESLLEGAEQTRDGAILGTPAYMSPEQAVGASGQVDARSDVWSLGVILYELLAGRRPFAGATTAETLREVATAVPAPVRQVCPEVAPELAAVAEQAMLRDTRLRYPSAAELASEVGRWLSGDRVVAYEYRSWELVQRFVRRNRALTALVTLLVVALVAAGLATRSRYLVSRHLAAESLAGLGDGALEALRWDEAAALFAASRVQEDSLRAQLSGAFARHRASVPLPPRTFQGVTVEAFCPLLDGGILAVTNGAGGAQLLDPETGAVRARVLSGPVAEATCTRDPARLVTGVLRDGGVLEVQQWGLPGGEPAAPSFAISGVAEVGWFEASPDAQRLAVSVDAAPDGPTRLAAYRLSGGQPVMDRDAGTPNALAFAPGGHTLWWYEAGHLWTLPADAGTPRPDRYAPEMWALRGLPTGELVVGLYNGSVERIPADPASQALPLRAPTSGPVDWISATDDGLGVLTRDARNFSVTIWDWSTKRPAPVAVLGTRGVVTVVPPVLSPDGSRVHWGHVLPGATRLFSWRLPDASADHLTPPASGAAAMSADGNRVAFKARGGAVQVFELPSRRPVARITTPVDYTKRQVLSLSAHGERLAIQAEGRVEVYALEGDGAPHLIATTPETTPPVVLSPDGQLLLTTSYPNSIQLRSVDRQAVLWSRPFAALSGAFLPDGRLALGETGAVSVLDARDGTLVRRWQLEGDAELMGLAASHDGRTLAACSPGGVWRLDLGEDRVTRLGADCSGWWVATSRDGSLVAASGVNVSVWSGDTTSPVLTFPEEGFPNFVAFAPDGRALYHAGERIQRVSLPMGELTAAPEDELDEVLRTYRLAFDGQKVVPAP